MGIDGIGKGGGLPKAPDAGGVQQTTPKGGVERPFEVERSGPAREAAPTEGAADASPLARLRAGEVDLEGYLDLEVNQATRGLEHLPSADLAEIKRVLRDQMATDPGLSDLVRQATGQVPSVPED